MTIWTSRYALGANTLARRRRGAYEKLIMQQDLETECLKHGSTALQEIGLSMLKHISSHRGLTYVPHAITFQMPNAYTDQTRTL